MPSIHPHLTILSPSPTTVSFTVTTSPPRQSFAAHCTHWFLLVVRALIALVTLLFLTSKYFQSEILLSSHLLQKLDLVPWLYIGTSSAVILFLTLRRFHIGGSCALRILSWYSNLCNLQLYLFRIAEESLLTLRTLGIQTSSVSPYYLLPATTRFIPTSQIRDILVHEAFRGFEVRYYLAIVVEGEAEVVVVFPVSLYVSLCPH